MANWSETMQEKTLDSLASVERTVLHLRREQFAGNGGTDGNSFNRLLRLVNDDQRHVGVHSGKEQKRV